MATNKTPQQATLETITPDIAYNLLLTSKGNRTVRPDKVGKLVGAMKEGKFKPNNDAICIDWNGVLINGHHRLNAVVLSFCTVEMYVIRGMDPEIVTTMDQNARRSLADQLRMSGLDNSTQRAAIVSMVARIIVGTAVELNDEAEYYEWLAPVEKGVNAFFELGCAQSAAHMRTAKVAGPLVMAYKADPAKMTEFFVGLRDGANLSPRSPVLTLREFLLDEYRNKKTQRSTPDTIIGKVFASCKKYLEGGTLAKVLDSTVATNHFRSMYNRGNIKTLAKEERDNRSLARRGANLLNYNPAAGGLPEHVKKMSLEEIRKLAEAT